MSIKIYETENELSVEITAAQYKQIMLAVNPETNQRILNPYQVEDIRQQWLTSESLADGTMRTRIRQTKPRDTFNEPTITYEYTTKFYWNNVSYYRTEINASITEQEYLRISSQYNTPIESKVRVYIQDTETGARYTADLISKDLVRLEIEFDSPEARKAYRMPHWLINILNNKNDNKNDN